jgi:hypothetical protein
MRGRHFKSERTHEPEGIDPDQCSAVRIRLVFCRGWAVYDRNRQSYEGACKQRRGLWSKRRGLGWKSCGSASVRPASPHGGHGRGSSGDCNISRRCSQANRRPAHRGRATSRRCRSTSANCSNEPSHPKPAGARDNDESASPYCGNERSYPKSSSAYAIGQHQRGKPGAQSSTTAGSAGPRSGMHGGRSTGQATTCWPHVGSGGAATAAISGRAHPRSIVGSRRNPTGHCSPHGRAPPASERGATSLARAGKKLARL